MTPTYAIGDVHGHADRLDALLAMIDRHAAGREHRLVVLGDAIDRGPDSAGAVRRLMALEAAAPDRVVVLTGNHEDMLLAALDGGARERAHWLLNGGGETLDSFGVEDAADIPGDVLRWIAARPTLHGDPRRWFVHAGLDPDLPAEASDRHTRLWIREPFLSAGRDFGRHVVHGHTPTASGGPERLAHRTNLDTGAAYGGPLTAGVFTDGADGPVDILQA